MFCKKCGTLYPESLKCCPKCNSEEIMEDARQQEYKQPEQTTRQEIIKNWIMIIVGVPCLIIFIYSVVSIFYGLFH